MSGAPEGADYRISIYTKMGIKLCEIDASFHCIWTMPPNIGTAFLTISLNDPKCTYRNFNIGNYVLFQHERLGDWCGIITPINRKAWNASDKTLTISMMQVEYHFSRRRAGAGAAINGTAGVIFKQLCQMANDVGDCLIRFDGYIWGGGVACDIVDPKDAMLLDLMADVIVKSPVDWWFEPLIDPKNNNLYFSARLAQKRGTNRSYALREGFNIETPTGDFYTEEGNLINDVIEVGSAAQNAGAPKATAKNPFSIAEYGVWQGSESNSATDQATVQSAADICVVKNAQPLRKYLLTAIETVESPYTFAKIGQGDDVLIDIYSVGFFGLGRGNGVNDTARVISREFTTDDKRLILVTETQNIYQGVIT